MNFNKMLNSFKYAFNGIVKLFLNENNAKFHLLGSIIVFVAGFVLEISSLEWIIVLILISLVFASEAINTAIEKICDFIHPEHHPKIGDIKDLASAAVLIIVIFASMVGFLIFVPKIIELFNSFN